MTHIAKHHTGLSPEHIAKIWQNQIEGAAEILEFLADDRLDLVTTTCTQFADYALSAHAVQRADGVAYGWQRFARSVLSAAELTVGTQKTVAFEADPPAAAVVLTAIPGGDALVSHSKLLDAFFAANLCRDQASLQRFAALKLDKLQSSAMRSSEQAVELAGACQLAIQGNPNALATAVSVMQKSTPAPTKASIAHPYVNLIISCQAEMLFRMLDPATTAELANKTLVEALQSHQMYYTLGEAHHGGDPRDSRGYFCLHANAFAAWMHDQGLARTVTSEYLSEPVISKQAIAGVVLVR